MDEEAGLQEPSDTVDEVIPEDTSPLEVTIKDKPKEPTPYDSTDAEEYDDLMESDKEAIKKDLNIDG